MHSRNKQTVTVITFSAITMNTLNVTKYLALSFINMQSFLCKVNTGASSNHWLLRTTVLSKWNIKYKSNDRYNFQWAVASGQWESYSECKHSVAARYASRSWQRQYEAYVLSYEWLIVHSPKNHRKNGIFCDAFWSIRKSDWQNLNVILQVSLQFNQG